MRADHVGGHIVAHASWRTVITGEIANDSEAPEKLEVDCGIPTIQIDVIPSALRVEAHVGIAAEDFGVRLDLRLRGQRIAKHQCSQ